MAPLSSTSRYLQTRITNDVKPHYVGWVPPSWGVPDSETITIITSSDVNRVDLLSQRLYGRTDLWWCLLHYNGIIDPFNLTVGDKILVPNLQYLLGVLSRVSSSNATLMSADPSIEINLPLITPPKPAPAIVPFVSPTISSTPTAVTISGFNIGLELPYGLTGLVGLQLQVATDPGFLSVVMSRITMSSQSNWSYYDPFINSQRGGYVAFPAAGIDGATYAGSTVYYSVAANDPLIGGNTYYIRFCTWVDQSAGIWIVPTPIIY